MEEKLDKVFICSKCNEPLRSISQFFTHIKYVHDFSKDNYECRQANCTACAFSDIHSFKKHFIRKHVDQEANQNISFDSTTNVEIDVVMEGEEEDQIQSDTECVMEEEFQEKIAKPFEFSDFKKKIEESATLFVAKLFNESTLSNKMVSSIIENIKKNVTTVIASYMKNLILPIISKTSDRNSIEKFFDVCSNPFSEVDTEYKFIKKLEKEDVYSAPIQFTINNEITEIKNKGITVLGQSNSTGVINPIEFQIKKFFELPNVLDSAINYMLELEETENENEIKNFTQGKLWKSKKASFGSQDIVIPYFLYNDDFEPNNALGSHAGSDKLSAFYYNFPTVPRSLSALESIFVAMIYKSSYVSYGYDRCLYYLIDVLKKLETEGIEIVTNNVSRKVYFVLGLVLGDNLGLNSILGFSKSFTANYFCRICKTHKCDTHFDLYEDVKLLRNIQNFEEDLSLDCLSSTGINANSLFNTIKTFHVTENYCVDILHDLAEGVHRYEIPLILNNFIKKNYFDLDKFNKRKQNFDYGEIDIGNLTVPISKERLLNNHLSLTASEMFCLVKLLPLMIGDLVNKKDKVWHFLQLLIKITEFALQNQVNTTKIDDFMKDVAEHNKLYMVLFNETLKPKHHFLVHYGTVIRNSGPLKHLWTMRHEAKHKELKRYCNVTNSRINLPLSVSKKCSLKFGYFMLYNKAYGDDLTVHSIYSVEDIDKNHYSDLIPFNLDDLTFSKFITYKGTNYKSGYFLASPQSIKECTVYCIKEIIIHEKIPYFIVVKYNCQFNEHLVSFLLLSEPFNEYYLKPIEMFNIYQPFIVHNLSTSQKAFRLATF